MSRLSLKSASKPDINIPEPSQSSQSSLKKSSVKQEPVIVIKKKIEYEEKGEGSVSLMRAAIAKYNLGPNSPRKKNR